MRGAGDGEYLLSSHGDAGKAMGRVLHARQPLTQEGADPRPKPRERGGTGVEKWW